MEKTADVLRSHFLFLPFLLDYCTVFDYMQLIPKLKVVRSVTKGLTNKACPLPMLYLNYCSPGVLNGKCKVN